MIFSAIRCLALPLRLKDVEMNNNLEVKVYTSEGRQKGLASMIKEMFHDLWRSRDLGFRLANRDIRSTYRQSFLGMFWAFITPLMTALVWIFLNAAGVVKIGNTPIPYPAYVFSGTIVWAIFSESILAPITQTQSAKSMMGKINFPKEGLLVSGFYKLSFNTAIKLLLMVVVLLFMEVIPDWRVILVPFLVLVLMFLGFVIGLALTPIGMLYGDVGRAIPIGLQLLMFLSPVVYGLPSEGILRTIMNLNPVTPIIISIRNYMSGTDFYMPEYFWLIFGLTLIVSLFVWILYRLSIPIIVER